jgi:hypothetical protein
MPMMLDINVATTRATKPLAETIYKKKGDTIMNGRELKEFAAQVHDEAVIMIREYGYNTFKEEFDMQAVLATKRPTPKAVPHG